MRLSAGTAGTSSLSRLGSQFTEHFREGLASLAILPWGVLAAVHDVPRPNGEGEGDDIRSPPSLISSRLGGHAFSRSSASPPPWLALG